MALVRALVVIGLLCGLPAPGWLFACFLPAVVWLLITEFSVFRSDESTFHIAGYISHRLFVVSFTAIQIIWARLAGLSVIVCAVLGAFTLLLNVTYSRLPGKAFPTMKEVVSLFHTGKSVSQ